MNYAILIRGAALVAALGAGSVLAQTKPADTGTAPSAVTDVADHIDHIRDIAGIDAVGVGSDFDGVEAVPEGLEDVSRLMKR